MLGGGVVNSIPGWGLKGLKDHTWKDGLGPSLWIIKGNIPRRFPRSYKYATNIETPIWVHEHGWPYGR